MTAADLLRVVTLQDYNTRIVLLGTILFGACGGVVGSFTLLRKKSLVGDVASHAAMPGIFLAYLILESISPGSGKSPVWLLVGAAVSSACGLLCAGMIQRTRLIKEDAALGIVLSVFFGFGIVLMSVVQSLPSGSSAGLNEFVFGKAAGLTASDVTSIATASLIVLSTCILLFKEFSVLCFDEAYAAALGWPTRRLDLLLTSLVVAVAVIGMPSVGLLLVVAQLVIPPTAARFWTDRHGTLAIMSGALGSASCAVGILVSAARANAGCRLARSSYWRERRRLESACCSGHAEESSGIGSISTSCGGALANWICCAPVLKWWKEPMQERLWKRRQHRNSLHPFRTT